MGKLLRNILLFLFPVIMLGISFELLLRNIPKVPRYKEQYLLRHSGNIEALILGNSHFFYGINPAYFKERCFNAAYLSQPLYIDLELLKKYKGNLSRLKHLVIPLSYHSLRESRMERPGDYIIYFDLDIPARINERFELLNGSLRHNLSRLYGFYVDGKNEIWCDSLGWGTHFYFPGKNDEESLEERGQAAAEEYTLPGQESVKKNSEILKNIVRFAGEHNIHILFVTPPCYHTYTSRLNGEQMEEVTVTGYRLQAGNRSVSYVNLLNDESFVAGDFYDADHLNAAGAKKLTLKIDSILSRMQH